MSIHVKVVTAADEAQLIRYCAEHGPEHDGSFLPGRDFAVSAECPAYLLMDDAAAATGAVVGAAVLLGTRPHAAGQKRRFSVFHSLLGTRAAYAALLEAVRPHLGGLHSAYLFIPEQARDMATILAGLGFQVERRSYVLRRSGPGAPARFPDGYRVQHLTPADDAGIEQFARCINAAFSALAGHTDSTADDIRAYFDDEFYLEGGICLLKQGEEAVGTVGILRDSDDPHAAEVYGLGVDSGHRGQGLGRNLLRYACAFAAGRGLDPVFLSVNAENDRALQLYLAEGFAVAEAVVCYALDCTELG